MWLMYIHQLDPLYKSYGSKNSPGVIWGHRGQKVIFTKNATSPTVYRVWSCDSCTCISLTPLYKSYGSKNSPGVIWGHRGQKVIFTINATSPTDYRVRSRDSCTYIRLTPSTNVMGLKINTGSFGVTGVKRSFSPKMLLPLEITWHGHIIHAYESARYPVSKLWV